MLFNIFGLGKADKDRPYPGYRLHYETVQFAWGSYDSTSANGSIDISSYTNKGWIPLLGYIRVWGRPMGSGTVYLSVSTNNGMILNMYRQCLGDWQNTEMPVDFTRGNIDEYKKISRITWSQAVWQMHTGVIQIRTWLVPED